jgi:hypothetical protein
MRGYRGRVTTLTLPAPSIDDIEARDLPVRIAVLLVRRNKPEAAVKVSGPVRAAVRAAFAHPRLTAPLQTLQMDADRLINRILSRWEHPGHEDEAQQWEKSDGSMTVRWWVDRDDALSRVAKRS